MKERLDVLLVKHGLAESREKAKAIIMSGIVYVDGRRRTRPAPPLTRRPEWRSEEPF